MKEEVTVIVKNEEKSVDVKSFNVFPSIVCMSFPIYECFVRII